MWKLVYGSVAGTSHAVSGQPCQDFCAGLVAGKMLVAACSDGAGSADLSHLGSKAAVESFLEQSASLETVPTPEQMKTWVSAARDRVLEEATAHETSPRQLACTLLVAIVGESWVAIAQIGDGVIVFDSPDGYQLAYWPDIGEYANTTRFLTEDDYLSHLRIYIDDRTVTELAMLTDGLQMLALDFAQSKVHDRFFSPLFQTVKNGPSEESLQESLRSFMDSKRVNERTDDDKTLLLAIRIATDDPPSLPDPTA